MKKSELQKIIKEEVEKALIEEGFFGDLSAKIKRGTAKNYIKHAMPNTPEEEIDALADAFAAGGIKGFKEKRQEIKLAKVKRPVGRPRKDAEPPKKRGRKAGTGWSEKERETRAQAAKRKKQEKLTTQTATDEAEAARLRLQNERERQRQLQQQRYQRQQQRQRKPQTQQEK
jgi:hypothetical protein